MFNHCAIALIKWYNEKDVEIQLLQVKQNYFKKKRQVIFWGWMYSWNTKWEVWLRSMILSQFPTLPSKKWTEFRSINRRKEGTYTSIMRRRRQGSKRWLQMKRVIVWPKGGWHLKMQTIMATLNPVSLPKASQKTWYCFETSITNTIMFTLEYSFELQN